MKATLLLNYSENTRQVEEEEKSRFLRNILDQCFEDTEASNQIAEIWQDEGVLSVQNKIKLRNILAMYHLTVIDDLDGGMKIFLDKELIGEWLKSSYRLRRDAKVTDPKYKIYLEMNIECWSIFDQPEESTEI